MLDFGTSCYLYPGEAPENRNRKITLIQSINVNLVSGYDLALFFLTSTTPDLRRQHLDPLLRRYHQTLVKVVKSCREDEDVEDYFAFEDLMEDYK